MHTAYLITAYHQPGHLARLIRTLSCDWARFFVHIDAKVDIEPFKEAVLPENNVTFLNEESRATCWWGGFGLIQAILNLMRAATCSDTSFHRYALLSGSDYPIKKLSRIHEEFCTDQEYISVDRRLNDLPDGNFFRGFVRYYWYTDWPFLHRLGFSGKLKRSLYRPCPLYQGSTWWSLTERCVEHILSFVDSNPDYVRFHQYTRVPDEVFFHTIVRNSPFAGKIIQDFELAQESWRSTEDNEYARHYIDWHAKVDPLPKKLSLDDLEHLRNTPALFARKFETGISDAVLAAIDSEIIT